MNAMTTISLDELGKRAAELLDGGDAVIVTRDEDTVAVIYPIRNPEEVPLEVRRQRFAKAIKEIGKQIGPNVTEEEIARDLAADQERRRGR